MNITVADLDKNLKYYNVNRHIV